jgi:branched-chain amino acid transport system substrate-binding protein
MTPLIDSAVRQVRGDLSNTDGLRSGLKRADFSSLRGQFKFNVNGYPIQNLYLTKVAKRPDGKYQTEIVKTIFENHGDSYAHDCKSNRITRAQPRLIGGLRSVSLSSALPQMPTKR